MAYTIITNEQIDPESPVTSELMTALRDNDGYNADLQVLASGVGALDVKAAKAFTHGVLDADITISFSNLRTSCAWSYYSAIGFTSFADVSALGVRAAAVADSGGNFDGLAISANGLWLFSLDQTNTCYEYSLTNPFSLAGASATGVTFGMGTVGLSSARCLAFSDDGTRAIVGDNAASNQLRELSLSTPWRISTASASGSTLTISGTTGSNIVNGVCYVGDKLYVVSLGDVFEYDLGAGQVLAGTTYSGNTFDPVAELSAVSIGVTQDGLKMLLSNRVGGNDSIFEYDLSTAYDVSTAVYSGNTFNFNTTFTSYGAGCMATDGRAWYHHDEIGNAYEEWPCAALPVITLPASIDPLLTPPPVVTASLPIRYDFFTTDGGTTVYLASGGD